MVIGPDKFATFDHDKGESFWLPHCQHIPTADHADATVAHIPAGRSAVDGKFCADFWVIYFCLWR